MDFTCKHSVQELAATQAAAFSRLHQVFVPSVGELGSSSVANTDACGCLFQCLF